MFKLNKSIALFAMVGAFQTQAMEQSYDSMSIHAQFSAIKKSEIFNAVKPGCISASQLVNDFNGKIMADGQKREQKYGKLYFNCMSEDSIHLTVVIIEPNSGQNLIASNQGQALSDLQKANLKNLNLYKGNIFDLQMWVHDNEGNTRYFEYGKTTDRVANQNLEHGFPNGIKSVDFICRYGTAPVKGAPGQPTPKGQLALDIEGPLFNSLKTSAQFTCPYVTQFPEFKGHFTIANIQLKNKTFNTYNYDCIKNVYKELKTSFDQNAVSLKPLQSISVSGFTVTGRGLTTGKKDVTLF